jgi:hypothetical protein
MIDDLEKRAEIDRKLSQLRAQHRAAIAASNWAEVTRLQAEIAELMAQKDQLGP